MCGKVWWRGIGQDVENLIADCHYCQITSQASNTSVPVTTRETPKQCWNILVIDMQGLYPSNDYTVAAIDPGYSIKRYYQRKCYKRFT